MKIGLGIGIDRVKSSGSTLDESTQLVINEGDSNGFASLSDSYLTALDTFIVESKDNGLWSRYDIIYLHALGSDYGRLNIKNPGTFTLSLTGSVTYNASLGFSGFGSGNYFDTGYNTNDDKTNVAPNDAAAFCWVSASLTGNASYQTAIGGGSATQNDIILAPIAADNTKWRSGVQGFAGDYGAGGATGSYIASSISAGLQNRYYNGGAGIQSQGTGTTSSDSTTSITIGVFNDSGSKIFPMSSGTISITGVSAGMSDKVSELHTVMSNFNTNILL